MENHKYCIEKSQVYEMDPFEVLPGLPPYGPSAESFSPTGLGQHHEGLVVRFQAKNGDTWVGNFQPGLGGIDFVAEHPNGREMIVVHGGQGYVVDPHDLTKRSYFGCTIEFVEPVPELSEVIFGDGLQFQCLGQAGRVWQSNRISWDGMCDLRRVDRVLYGKAWSPIDDRWLPFELDLVTGTFTGGSYFLPAT
ncbi:MAG TPA: hypothetical protein VGJ05_11350 [Fimbriiglobus sp.]